MQQFFEELTVIETKYADFFEKNPIPISKYIRTLTNPAMASFSTSMGRIYPLPEEIRAKIDLLIAKPRILNNGRAKVNKIKAPSIT
jgi:hypothetical protein